MAYCTVTDILMIDDRFVENPVDSLLDLRNRTRVSSIENKVRIVIAYRVDNILTTC